jgi:hypothetical protein
MVHTGADVGCFACAVATQAGRGKDGEPRPTRPCGLSRTLSCEGRWTTVRYPSGISAARVRSAAELEAPIDKLLCLGKDSRP